MSRTLSIAVAGAGIGGLAAASLLARQGHRVTVFDQFEAAGPVGSGPMLQETGLVILGQLGHRYRAEALGAPVTRLWGISSETGRAVLDVRYEALRAGLRGIGIQRTALFALLHEAALASGAELLAHSVPTAPMHASPAHTTLDGDTLFALATGTEAGPVDLMLLTVMAAEATALATVDAIRQARGISTGWGDVPAATDWVN